MGNPRHRLYLPTKNALRIWREYNYLWQGISVHQDFPGSLIIAGGNKPFL